MAQAKRLVYDLKTKSEYNFEKDWKLVTVFIGGNNLCQLCTDPNSSPKNFLDDVENVLDYLHQNLTRAFVNMVTIFDISFVRKLSADSPICRLAHTCFCPCGLKNPLEAFRASRKYIQLVTDLVASGRCNSRQDFTVVVQPFFEDIQPPKVDGKIDLSFFAPDCFHLSQRGHNAAGRALWNNMFETKKTKPNTFDNSTPIKFPTEENPYLVA